jgi:hypothetical protein
MFRWIGASAGLTVSAFSFYMAWLAMKAGDSGVYLFSAFGLLFGLGFFAFVLPVLSKRWPRIKKISRLFSGEPRAVTFVPHRFIASALILTVLFILAALLIPLLFP